MTTFYKDKLMPKVKYVLLDPTDSNILKIQERIYSVGATDIKGEYVEGAEGKEYHMIAYFPEVCTYE